MPPRSSFGGHRGFLQLSDRVQRSSRGSNGNRFFRCFFLLGATGISVPNASLSARRVKTRNHKKSSRTQVGMAKTVLEHRETYGRKIK